jgi:hypothetical protein
MTTYVCIASGPSLTKERMGMIPDGFSNAVALKRWSGEFEKLHNAYVKLGIDLFNCSLDTALKN